MATSIWNPLSYAVNVADLTALVGLEISDGSQANGTLVYVVATDQFYRFSLTSGAPLASPTVLATFLGGDTRWLLTPIAMTGPTPGMVEVLRFPMSLAPITTSLISLPAGARIFSATVEITSPFVSFFGPPSPILITGGATLVQPNQSDVTVAGFYTEIQDTVWTATGPVIAFWNGPPPTGGAGDVLVQYALSTN